MPGVETQPVAGSSPHSVSLKVLRLSKPSLAVSNTLPSATDASGVDKASLAYPSQTPDTFRLAPLLTLPPSFGAAYVGETFACTLCANNEVGDRADAITVKNVEIDAELQTPGSQEAVKLQLEVNDDARAEALLTPDESLQGIVRHVLAEEGQHTLAVTVTYVEVASSSSSCNEEDGSLANKTRTFRKLYQFVAQQAVGVRTKITELPHRKPTELRRFAMEAQLENLTDQPVLLEHVTVEAGRAVKSTSLNATDRKALLAPQDVEQVAFVLDQVQHDELEEEAGRYVVARLSVRWRLTMGEKGTLTTGWLGCRKR